MLDPKLFRQDIQELSLQLSKRGFKLDESLIQSLEDERKTIQIGVQDLQMERNSISKSIGQLKSKGENTYELFQNVAIVSNKLKDMEESLDKIQESLQNYYLEVPNILDDSVPIGKNETKNQQVRAWGNIPTFNFEPVEHHEISASQKLMDFSLAADITGSRFVVLHSQFARLHRALIQFMLDSHVQEHGYQEIYVPYIVNAKSLENSGQLPKFKDDLFNLSDSNYYLIPTAEVPVTNAIAGKILNESDLPLKYVCHTPCFRKEAGSYGKDTKGMIRQHQFDKVELVCISTPDKSNEMLESLTGHAENILQKLKLPYRVMELCSGDVGFAASKTYDLEVWLPGQKKYREISSCSNCGDFQARRMKARYRVDGKPQLLHTLNGSGLAVGRTMVAILENYQQSDGSIKIPDVLVQYMGGVQEITI